LKLKNTVEDEDEHETYFCEQKKNFMILTYNMIPWLTLYGTILLRYVG